MLGWTSEKRCYRALWLNHALTQEVLQSTLAQPCSNPRGATVYSELVGPRDTHLQSTLLVNGLPDDKKARPHNTRKTSMYICVYVYMITLYIIYKRYVVLYRYYIMHSNNTTSRNYTTTVMKYIIEPPEIRHIYVYVSCYLLGVYFRCLFCVLLLSVEIEVSTFCGPYYLLGVYFL